MSGRGVVAAFAMARPAKDASELGLVHVALAGLPSHLSHRGRCRILAKRVVAEVIAASIRTDPMEIALAEASARLTGDPVTPLAVMLAGDVRQERITRFVARGCVQIDAVAWDAETKEIALCIEGRLAERFRRPARKWAQTGFTPSETCNRASIEIGGAA